MDMTKLFEQFGALQGMMQDFQKEIAQLKVTKEAGAGLVKVVVNGKKQLCDMTIDPSLFSQENHMMARDLILSAVNAALDAVDKRLEEMVQKKTMGL